MLTDHENSGSGADARGHCVCNSGPRPARADAQILLGVMYAQGCGVPKDCVQAYMWLNLTAAEGINDAAKLRDGLEYSMTPEQIAGVQQRTAAW